MTYALISNAGPLIQWVVHNFPNPFLLPNGTQEYPTTLPWTSSDSAYTLVQVAPFVTPPGQMITSGPTYTLANGAVAETYQTQAIPAPPVAGPSPYDAALAAGLTITSVSTPTVNGTYDVIPAAQTNFNAVETYVLTNGTFPLGATQFWFLLNGTQISIPSAAIFKAIANAVAQYVAALEQQNGIQQSGGVPVWPSATVAII